MCVKARRVVSTLFCRSVVCVLGHFYHQCMEPESIQFAFHFGIHFASILLA